MCDCAHNKVNSCTNVADDELLYLDPHTCQAFEDASKPPASDESYHCPYKCRMNVSELDPSIALVRKHNIHKQHVVKT